MTAKPPNARFFARGSSAAGWCAGVLAVLVGATVGSWTVARLQADADANLRLAELERRLQPTAASAEKARSLRAAAHTTAASQQPRWRIQCAPAWQELGAIGQGLWGCRPPEPLPGGFYPNCNLTASHVEPGQTPQQYYTAATAHSAQLSTATQHGGSVIDVHGRTAYRASFDHTITGSPLRVLATVFVAQADAYAITCSAPPAAFDAFAPRFRAISDSFELQR